MRNKNMRGKRGMAMVSVMFAMTIVMLFGVLITANAMNAGNAVKLYEVNTKQRDKLSEVGEYFVAKVVDLSDAKATAETLQTAIKSEFPDLTYDFVVTVPTGGNINGAYTLSVQRTVKAETPAEEGGETIPAEYKIYFAVKVQKNGGNDVTILTWRYGV